MRDVASQPAAVPLRFDHVMRHDHGEVRLVTGRAGADAGLGKQAEHPLRGRTVTVEENGGGLGRTGTGPDGQERGAECVEEAVDGCLGCTRLNAERPRVRQWQARLQRQHQALQRGRHPTEDSHGSVDARLNGVG